MYASILEGENISKINGLNLVKRGMSQYFDEISLGL